MADNTNVDEAVSVLSNVIESVERRIERIDQRHTELSRKRKAYLAETVDALLPAISGRTFRNVQEAAPAFMTQAVCQCFETNRKFLGLFAGSGYNQALSLLQIRLASHLDQVKYGELQNIDAELAQLTTEKTSLNIKSKDTVEVLKLLQHAKQKGIPLPVELTVQLDRIITASHTGQAQKAVRPSSSFSPSSVNSTTSTSSDHDDSDIWLYMLTDIPTSARTLLLSTIQDHDHGLHAGEQAIHSDGSGINIGAGAATIATDDSLGYFS